ncbi:MAG: asparaginase, partial [Blastocatellia bacterium]
MPAKILARVFRGRTLESIHRGHYIVIDHRRKPIASAGDPGIITFMRSAAKPIQALHLVSEGTADAYGFSNEEIALACASHSGEPRHTRIAVLMLDRVGLTEAHLHCGRHLPFNEKEAERMLGAGEYPTQLHNNCSGKHAAMLATAKHLGSDLNTYEKISHPLQQKIFQDLAEFAETSAEKIQVATDGCSAPNFAVSLSAMAVSFLNLVAP